MSQKKDLIVLVADADMEQAVQGMLTQTKTLEIRPVDFEVRRHVNKDGGCRTGAVEFLRPFLGSYQHCLVMFDLDGCGSRQPRVEIQQRIESDLERNGWKDRSKVVVIDPELEIWVWSSSPRVSEVLGWGPDFDRLRIWLLDQGLWPVARPKPEDPKKAMQEAMAMGHLPGRARRSSAKFNRLAKNVSFTRCQDPAFTELRRTLRNWFPVANQ